MKSLKNMMIISVVAFSSTSLFAQTATEKSKERPKESIRDSAANTQKSNQMGQIINMAVGGVNLYTAYECFGQCGSGGGGCCSMAPMLLAMGMANLAQASADGKTAGQAGGTLGMTDINFGGGYDPGAINSLTKDPEIKAGIDFGTAMTNADPSKGMSWDSTTGTVTTASGKTYKASDFNSPGAMAAAGISKSAIDSIMGMEQNIQDKAMKKVDKMGLLKNVVVNGAEEGSSGGGGGGSGMSNGMGDETGALGYAGAGGSKLGVDRDPAQVAGMQKDFNGEPIGVAADSIFKMMTRRYKVKESQSSFLDDSALLQK